MTFQDIMYPGIHENALCDSLAEMAKGKLQRFQLSDIIRAAPIIVVENFRHPAVAGITRNYFEKAGCEVIGKQELLSMGQVKVLIAHCMNTHIDRFMIKQYIISVL